MGYELSINELVAWASQKIEWYARRHETLARQVDECYARSGDFRFLVARESMSSLCMKVRHEWCLMQAVEHGDPFPLRCLWEETHASCEADRLGMESRVLAG
jgi:hypothetical protein